MKKGKGFLIAAVMSVLLMTSAVWMRPFHVAAFENDPVAMEERVIALQNAHRANAGLSPLTVSASLDAAADIRAAECGISFSHTRPDGSVWWTVSPEYTFAENLAYGYASADDAVTAWMNSPEHRYNLMDPEFRTCGVGVTWANGRWYYVVEFGY